VEEMCLGQRCKQKEGCLKIEKSWERKSLLMLKEGKEGSGSSLLGMKRV